MAVEYMVNLKRVSQDLKEDDLVLVGLNDYRWVGSERVHATALGRVKTVGHDTVDIEVPDLGTLKGQRPNRYSTSLDLKNSVRELDLLAVNTLTTADRDTVYSYLDRLAAFGQNKPIALHVIASGESGMTGRLIGHGFRDETDQLAPVSRAEMDQENLAKTFALIHEEVGIPIAEIGSSDVTNAFDFRLEELPKTLSSPQPVPQVNVGDIVVARDFGFEFVDGKPVARLVDASVIGRAATLEAAVIFLGLDTVPGKPGHGNEKELSDATQIQYAIDLAYSRTEPDTALVLAYDDGKGVVSHLLASSGYYSFVVDDIQDYFHDHVIEPGLWTIHNLAIRSWQSHEGDWDSDLEGDWLPASVDDVERLFGLEAIDNEIASVTETDEQEEGLGEKYMEMARRAVAEETFNQEHMVFARYRMGLLSKGRVPVEDIVNEDQLDAFLSEKLVAIEPELLRTQMTAAMKNDVFERHHLFHEVVTTEEEAEALQARKTWRKDRTAVVFLPDMALNRDIATVVAAVMVNSTSMMKQVERGSDFSRPSIKYVMGKIGPCVSRAGLVPFSPARNIEGEWLFVGKHKREVTLALFKGDAHVLTLVTTGEQARLVSPSGLEITGASGPIVADLAQPTYIPVDAALRDADRAIAELEARREVYGDYFRPVEDGVHEVHTTTIHVQDGVMHNDDGPALTREPRFEGDLPYVEYRFRGNLHRDDGPAIEEGDQSIWYRHGLEHRVNAPSSIIGNDQEYRQYNRLHREGGPAIHGDDSIGWYRNGLPHREGGPAMVHPTVREFYRAGRHHPIGEPAIEHDDGSHAFYVNGKRHNPDGPASVFAEHVIYAIDGEEMPFEEFESRKFEAAATTIPSP
jgi:hypothetical protein